MENSQKITLCCFKGTQDGKDVFLKTNFIGNRFYPEIVHNIQDATFLNKKLDIGLPIDFLRNAASNFLGLSFQIYYFEIEPPKLTILNLCSQKTCTKKPLVIHRTRSRNQRVKNDFQTL